MLSKLIWIDYKKIGIIIKLCTTARVVDPFREA